MANTIKAQRAEILLGDISLEIFMLPDGTYRMSQTQVARSVDRDERSFRRFLDSKWLKALPGKASDVGAFPLLERYGESGGARVRGVPLEIAVAYWVRECQRGSQTAAALVWACTTETLERRADNAFGVSRTETERNDRLASRIQTLERDLKELGDAYATNDIIRGENEELQRQLKAHGIEPFQDWPSEERRD